MRSGGMSVQSIIETVEDADIAVAQEAAEIRHHPVTQALGQLSEVADQVPLSLVCGSVILGGAVWGQDHVARTGLRMMAAHVLAP